MSRSSPEPGVRTRRSSRIWVCFAVAALLAGTAWLLRAWGASPADLTVDLSVELQTMDGFGASDIDSKPIPLSAAQRALLWDPSRGIGLSIYRALIGTDGQPRRDAGEYAKTPWDLWGELKAAVSINPELRVVAAPWSPPAAWKDSGHLNGGHLCHSAGQGACAGSRYGDWARRIGGYVAAASAQSPPIRIFAISPQNEPDLATSYSSCLYSPSEMVAFIKLLGPALASARPRPRIFAPESSDWRALGGYVRAIEADKVAASYVDEYATHQYGHPAALPPPPAAKSLWQTEMSGVSGGPEATWDPGIANGIATARWIHGAITTGNVSAWVYWWFYSAYNEGTPPRMTDNQALIVLGTDNTNATIAKRLFTIGNYSKFVRPGYVRVAVSGRSPRGLYVSAFKGAGGRIVAVAINENRSETVLSVAVRGGPSPPAFVPWVTSATRDLAPLGRIPVSEGTFRFTQPARSVTTLVGASAAPER